ncbi:hypothetical protein [Nonomuraea sp. NPDC003804]|uniref:hypothetical protein n=1 Tax=Nonomuraea sp. NPDC003804 TaxID=3154547 RepID=UPI00339E547E
MTEIAARMCGNKHRHPSRRQARAHLRSLVGAGQRRELLNVYKCWFCDAWHVGHRPAAALQRSGKTS